MESPASPNSNGPQTTNGEAGPPKRLVWVITGTSSGLGRSLVNVALSRGDFVVATARNVDSIRDFASNPETAARVHVMKLDVTSPFSDLRALADEVVGKWGRVDVLVNNAGAGFLGITEEVGAEGYQRQFAVNFFGPLNVTNAFLPYMRARRDGTIVFVGSRSSWRSHVAMMGTYAASKAALTAAAESLAVEVAPLNIRVLNVLPGGMQTCSWSKMTLLPTTPGALLPLMERQVNGELEENTKGPTAKLKVNGINESVEKRIEDYSELRERQIEWMRSAICEGDPDKCARAIHDLVRDAAVDGENGRRSHWPECNLMVLGADAEQNIRDKCNAVLRNLDEWRDVARGVAVV